jgi:hypothetical protein
MTHQFRGKMLAKSAPDAPQRMMLGLARVVVAGVESNPHPLVAVRYILVDGLLLMCVLIWVDALLLMCVLIWVDALLLMCVPILIEALWLMPVLIWVDALLLMCVPILIEALWFEGPLNLLNSVSVSV